MFVHVIDIIVAYLTLRDSLDGEEVMNALLQVNVNINQCVL